MSRVLGSKEPVGVGEKGSGGGGGGRSGSNLSLHDVDVLTNLIYLHVTTPLHWYLTFPRGG